MQSSSGQIVRNCDTPKMSSVRVSESSRRDAHGLVDLASIELSIQECENDKVRLVNQKLQLQEEFLAAKRQASAGTHAMQLHHGRAVAPVIKSRQREVEILLSKNKQRMLGLKRDRELLTGMEDNDTALLRKVLRAVCKLTDLIEKQQRGSA